MELRSGRQRGVEVYLSISENSAFLGKLGSFSVNVFLGLYHHCIQKRLEKKDFIEQDVLPSWASSAKQRTGWGGKELHTGTETTRHRCRGARYGKTRKGGVEEVKGSDGRMRTEKSEG